MVRAGVVGLGVTALVAGCGLSGIKKSIDRINASASATRFRSLVLRGQLVMITTGGTRGLGATVSG